MGYFDNINSIIEAIVTSLKTIDGVKEVGTKLRASDKDYIFPRVDVLPEREMFREYKIPGDMRHCLFTIRVIPAIKSYNESQGTSDLLKLTGQVYDKILSLRNTILHNLADDIYVNSIENFYFAVENYVLYVSSIIVVIEVRF